MNKSHYSEEMSFPGLAGGTQIVTTALQGCLAIPIEDENVHPHWPSNSTSRHLSSKNTYTNANIYTVNVLCLYIYKQRTFTAAGFAIAKFWRPPQHPFKGG